MHAAGSQHVVDLSYCGSVIVLLSNRGSTYQFSSSSSLYEGSCGRIVRSPKRTLQALHAKVAGVASTTSLRVSIFWMIICLYFKMIVDGIEEGRASSTASSLLDSVDMGNSQDGTTLS